MSIKMRTDDPLEHTMGACDLEIHAGPDLFKRIADDEEIALACRNAGMVAICIKGHSLNTARSAYFVRKHVPGIHVFGGVVLNWAVGGINPAAAIASFEAGGKALWLPSLDAKCHADYFGMTGSYATHDLPPEERLAEGHGASHLDFVVKGAGRRPGISLLEDGSLTKPAIEILEIVREYNGFLGTSHVSKDEIAAIVQYVRKTGRINVMITHPTYMVPNVSPAFLKEVCGGGVYAQIATGILWPSVSNRTVNDDVEIIRKVGAENCILVSDGGITYGTMPHDMLRVHGRLLRNAGITNEELHLMMRVNPKRMLDLSD